MYILSFVFIYNFCFVLTGGLQLFAKVSFIKRYWQFIAHEIRIILRFLCFNIVRDNKPLISSVPINNIWLALIEIQVGKAKHCLTFFLFDPTHIVSSIDHWKKSKDVYSCHYVYLAALLQCIKRTHALCSDLWDEI